MENRSGGCLGGLLVVVIILVITGVSLSMLISSISTLSMESKLKKSGVYIDGCCECVYTKEHTNDNEGVHSAHGSNVTYTYTMDVSYIYNGQLYTKRNVKIDRPYQQGSIVTICVLPENPNIMVEHFTPLFGLILNMVLGAFFMFLLVLILALSLSRNRAYKNTGTVNNGALPYANGAYGQDNTFVRQDDYEIFNSNNRRPYN